MVECCGNNKRPTATVRQFGNCVGGGVALHFNGAADNVTDFVNDWSTVGVGVMGCNLPAFFCEDAEDFGGEN